MLAWYYRPGYTVYDNTLMPLQQSVIVPESNMIPFIKPGANATNPLMGADGCEQYNIKDKSRRILCHRAA